MRPKSLVLLALALGCGLVASIGISQVLDGNNKPAPVETAPIYVALQNINVGDPMTDKMVALEEWPRDKVPVGAISTWEDLEDRRPRHPRDAGRKAMVEVSGPVIAIALVATAIIVASVMFSKRKGIAMDDSDAGGNTGAGSTDHRPQTVSA